MTLRLEDLPWLPNTPDDWNKMIQDLGINTPDIGPKLANLSSYRLDASKSRTLKKIAGKLRKSKVDFAPMSTFRLGVVAGSTFDIVGDCLDAAAFRHGVNLEMIQAPYGMIMQEVLNPASVVYSSNLDGLLVFADHRTFGLGVPSIDERNEAAVMRALQFTEDLLSALRSNNGPPAILQTLPCPVSTLFGSLDRSIAGSVTARIARFNSELPALATKYGAYVLDIGSLATQVGTAEWFNPIQWISYKLPFDAKMAPIYADWLGRLLGAIRGKSAKCLVLDLDNTCWGGVIGDDGMPGIILGQGSAGGEAYLAVQQVALNLKARGIFLSVASKNDFAIAIEPFKNHPEMLLRENDISVFQANWIDKATNLEAIAKTLNIGIDTLVLLDDNPAERKQVRDALPFVKVVEVPAEPAWFSWCLEACGFFEAVTFSDEDVKRASMFSEDVQRAQVMSGMRDLSDYLRALDMTLQAKPFDEQGRQRIIQLINKTNQFNLTTRRYTEAQVRMMESDRDLLTLQVRLTDRFGDLGMISVIICRPDRGDTLSIDTWLMSCRVLGRGVEAAIVSILVQEARNRGARRLLGTYLPTDKNILVADHYSKLGFVKIEDFAGGGSLWELDLRSYIIPQFEMHIEVERLLGEPH
jgi:FkbH-like protein